MSNLRVEVAIKVYSIFPIGEGDFLCEDELVMEAPTEVMLKLGEASGQAVSELIYETVSQGIQRFSQKIVEGQKK